jgi:hypothetical protein
MAVERGCPQRHQAAVAIVTVLVTVVIAVSPLAHATPGRTPTMRLSVHAQARGQRSLIFDGRAARMNFLRCDSERCSQRPLIWSGLQFCGDDIGLEQSARFGQVYRYHIGAESSLVGCPGAPIWSPAVAYASLNYLPDFQVLGTVEYYRESILLPRGSLLSGQAGNH